MDLIAGFRYSFMLSTVERHSLNVIELQIGVANSSRTFLGLDNDNADVCYKHGCIDMDVSRLDDCSWNGNAPTPLATPFPTASPQRDVCRDSGGKNCSSDEIQGGVWVSKRRASAIESWVLTNRSYIELDSTSDDGEWLLAIQGSYLSFSDATCMWYCGAPVEYFTFTVDNVVRIPENELEVEIVEAGSQHVARFVMEMEKGFRYAYRLSTDVTFTGSDEFSSASIRVVCDSDEDEVPHFLDTQNSENSAVGGCVDQRASREDNCIVPETALEVTNTEMASKKATKEKEGATLSPAVIAGIVVGCVVFVALVVGLILWCVLREKEEKDDESPDLEGLDFYGVRGEEVRNVKRRAREFEDLSGDTETGPWDG
jgi:hypothetical protein